MNLLVEMVNNGIIWASYSDRIEENLRLFTALFFRLQ